MEDNVIYYCSFCKKPNTECKMLIAGEAGFICDKCVNDCGNFLMMYGWEFKPKYSPMIAKLTKWVWENKE